MICFALSRCKPWSNYNLSNGAIRNNSILQMSQQKVETGSISASSLPNTFPKTVRYVGQAFRSTDRTDFLLFNWNNYYHRTHNFIVQDPALGFWPLWCPILYEFFQCWNRTGEFLTVKNKSFVLISEKINGIMVRMRIRFLMSFIRISHELLPDLCNGIDFCSW